MSTIGLELLAHLLPIIGRKDTVATATEHAPATRKSVFGLSDASAFKNDFHKCLINDDVILGGYLSTPLPSFLIVIEMSNR